MNASFGRNDDDALSGDQAAGTVPLGDTVARWCSRLVGYATLAAACTGVVGFIF